MIGFRMEEVMTGRHKFVGAKKENFMEFRIRWGPDDIIEWINPLGENFLFQQLEGDILVDYLNKIPVPCKGTLFLNYPKGYLEYQIRFQINYKKYLYVGRKTNLRPWNLHKTHTTCYGKIYRIRGDIEGVHDRELISSSILYFRLHTLPAFLKSFKFVRK
jgi:hypothetical protein